MVMKIHFIKLQNFHQAHITRAAMLEGAERTALSEGITRGMLDHWVLRRPCACKGGKGKRVLKDIIADIREGSNKDEGIRDRISQRL